MDEKQLGAAAPSFEGYGLAVEVPKADEPIPVTEEAKTAVIPGSTPTSSLSATLQGLTDKALHFLSHASSETLGACLAGLGVTTYLALGRVGLVIIGVAGGVVLHATWEGIRSDDRDEKTKKVEKERRREAGVEVMRRVLDWRAGKSLDDQSGEVKVYANQTLDFSRFEPEAAAALNMFIDAVVKDYVYYWYGPQIPGEESFPAACRRTLTAFILSLSGHLHRKRSADSFLDFVTNASSILIVFLNELSVAVGASPTSSCEDAINTYLQLKPESSLAYMVDQDSQNAKLANAAEDILQSYLDSKAYNCEPVHVFLKQVLAQLVLGSTVTLCSRPEWINEWIVYGLEESETTKEVMNIVDAGVEGRTTEKVPEKVEVRQEVESKTQGTRPGGEHTRQMSRAEEAMDEAMREARRLTQLMIEEDERHAREENEKSVAVSSSEDVSDATTQGAATPTSSQSDRDRQEEEVLSWTSASQAPSAVESPVTEQPTTPSAVKQQFTSFDQLVPSAQPTALLDSPTRAHTSPPAQQQVLTLHNAKISIFDDSQPNERSSIKSKPQIDYLVQIEPSSSAFPGWMIARKYADFEMLHEVLRRISVITGVQGFTASHAELPKWRVHTKTSLRGELEKYLTDAVRYQPLAESEGMKRFLEKDQGLSKISNAGNKGFGWPTPDAFGKLGGDMVNVLAKAPKQVAGGVTGGGKAVFDGVAGFVGGVAGGTSGAKKVPSNQSQGNLSKTSTQQNISSMALTDPYAGSTSMAQARQSQDSLRAPARPTLDRHTCSGSVPNAELRSRPSTSTQRSSFEAHRPENSAVPSPTSSRQAQPLSSPTKENAEQPIHLPPPPSEMPEDYSSPGKSTRSSGETFRSATTPDQRLSNESEDAQPPPQPPRPKPAQQKSELKPKEPLSEGETSVAVELMFAVITELYTLSSAWNIRRTLLAAAKTFLLRPGNPQLLTIRDLLQTSMLDANLSDSGLAGHIYKLRENALPTEEEMEVWRRDYPEKNGDEKEELRLKARRLLVTKGMPQALSSVMGAAASGEALGKVFDCLQVPAVGRGLIFGLMLQAIKVVTH